MAEYEPLAFSSNQAGDLSVLADYMRAQGYLLSECAGGSKANGPLLHIAWAPAAAGLAAAWTEAGQSFSHEERVIQAAFHESEENRRRRSLRLAVHRLLEKRAGAESGARAPSCPWGVLTGVRPVKMVHRFLDQGLSVEDVRSILAGDFAVEDGRIELLLTVAGAQRPFLPSPDQGRKKISLYLGYPFCPSRCAYCSFTGYELKRWRKWQDPYHLAIEREIRETGGAASRMGFSVESVYFGGGTPTCMPPQALDSLLTSIRESFDLTGCVEWTVESGRPETLTEEMLSVLASHPVTRICVNPQSMNGDTLERIGRRHDGAAVVEAVGRARAAAARRGKAWLINSDLILGLPGEGPADVADSVGQALAFRPDNLTLHGLAIKRGSAYKERIEGLPDSQDGLEMIRLSRDMAARAGYRPYYLYRQKDSLAGGENVGYCLPGRECLYNILMIEERQSILGLGAGAGSKFLTPGDWTLENVYNPKDMIQYIERVGDLIRRKVDKLAILE